MAAVPGVSCSLDAQFLMAAGVYHSSAARAACSGSSSACFCMLWHRQGLGTVLPDAIFAPALMPGGAQVLPVGIARA